MGSLAGAGRNLGVQVNPRVRQAPRTVLRLFEDAPLGCLVVRVGQYALVV